MILPVLVVDKSIEVSLRAQVEWAKHGIAAIRVDTMQEAIEKLVKEDFSFTAINADNVNYLPLLRAMREITSTFICITDSSYTAQREMEALYNGADVFTKFNDDVELNIELTLARLLRYNERNKQPKKPPGMVTYENFLILAHLRQVFYNDSRIKLTKKEYDLLIYLIENHDLTLSYNKIYRKVWGGDIDESSRKLLLNFIDKLRRKIKLVSDGRRYISNERDQGYIFSASSDS